MLLANRAGRRDIDYDNRGSRWDDEIINSRDHVTHRKKREARPHHIPIVLRIRKENPFVRGILTPKDECFSEARRMRPCRATPPAIVLETVSGVHGAVSGLFKVLTQPRAASNTVTFNGVCGFPSNFSPCHPTSRPFRPPWSILAGRVKESRVGSLDPRVIAIHRHSSR